MYIVTILFFTAIIVLLGIMVNYFRRTRQELKERNEQLSTALTMAEESDRMRTEFVRSISHEIRTPLNAINGFNELLNNPDIALNDEERKDLLARIKENMDAITNIIDEMLHMANQTSNSYSMNTTSIYCNQFLSPLIYNHREKVSGSVELLYKSKLINRDTIYTDPDGLRKIIDQLMNNAIKFTQSGFIELACEYSEDKHWVLISVTDTGRGVTEEQREKIFTPFHKADSFQQGIGLGLSISKKIAQRLGGDLMLDTDYTEGARFVLKIPANTQQNI